MRLIAKVRKITYWNILLLLSAILLVTTAVTVNRNQSNIEKYRQSLAERKDSTASVQAWANVYEVLTHARCMNCHPAGDIPLQGDDSHIHTMNPRRGVDGRGLYAMKCINCHHDEGVPGENTPPGNPKWHMPPADMKMVFEGKTAHELALQMVDPERNGHKSIDQLIEHVNDTLVKEGWNMGGDRELPSLTYKEFKAEWLRWIETGAYAPPAE